MVRIFWAHASEDTDTVEQLYNRLKRVGYKPWMDKMDLKAGQNWRQIIPGVIKNSDIFIACLSKTAITKQSYLQEEFKLALDQ
jgi:hypothetical protein